jgi:hypothetical protein
MVEYPVSIYRYWFNTDIFGISVYRTVLVSMFLFKAFVYIIFSHFTLFSNQNCIELQNCNQNFLGNREIVHCSLQINCKYKFSLGVKKNTCGSGSPPTLFFSADPIIFSTRLTVRPYFLQVVAGCSYSVSKWCLLSH